eukprot:CAMPEP_0113936188 /NCGR_PEP_ID=MMETSP1339-20121228/3155_1 /TAXON_ID=94617 /ORGANISM="Fibrocapsa japonica" /LENGTH=334 /DNA_ID=CAMNT_0000938569 /DNA_START=167 /DNA_END=1173 /DNA_ORIENTATION=- /assembly_acc=CAM_ASM_000762
MPHPDEDLDMALALSVSMETAKSEAKCGIEDSRFEQSPSESTSGSRCSARSLSGASNSQVDTVKPDGAQRERILSAQSESSILEHDSSPEVKQPGVPAVSVHEAEEKQEHWDLADIASGIPLSPRESTAGVEFATPSPDPPALGKENGLSAPNLTRSTTEPPPEVSRLNLSRSVSASSATSAATAPAVLDDVNIDLPSEEDASLPATGGGQQTTTAVDLDADLALALQMQENMEYDKDKQTHNQDRRGLVEPLQGDQNHMQEELHQQQGARSHSPNARSEWNPFQMATLFQKLLRLFAKYVWTDHVTVYLSPVGMLSASDVAEDQMIASSAKRK